MSTGITILKYPLKVSTASPHIGMFVSVFLNQEEVGPSWLPGVCVCVDNKQKTLSCMVTPGTDAAYLLVFLGILFRLRTSYVKYSLIRKTSSGASHSPDCICMSFLCRNGVMNIHNLLHIHYTCWPHWYCPAEPLFFDLSSSSGSSGLRAMVKSAWLFERQRRECDLFI